MGKPEQEKLSPPQANASRKSLDSRGRIGLPTAFTAIILLALAAWSYRSTLLPRLSTFFDRQLTLTDDELRAFDGSDPAKPIYLAIKGTIYDVSASPNFYGPGGHYHHFVGRDATRAWVTECWDSEEQLVYDIRDVEQMFMPKYLDEEMQRAAEGGASEEDNSSGAMPLEQLKGQASQLMKKIGKVGKKERERRRAVDRPVAEKQVEEKLAHWISFFEDNAKYKVVGRISRSELSDDAAPPPPLCEAALKKKPIKGGKLDYIMSAGGNVANAGSR